MKDYPILFSAPMVRALLADTKTQTRRIVKVAEQITKVLPAIGHPAVAFALPGEFVATNTAGNEFGIRYPYGQPGDRLWVREEHYAHGSWLPAALTRTGKRGRSFLASGFEAFRYPDNPPPSLTEDVSEYNGLIPGAPLNRTGYYKRLARFMPRAASRLLLEIVSVRVERLQDISQEDAVAEGIYWSERYSGYVVDEEGSCYHGSSAVRSYEKLWASLNGPDSWDANPWVWCISFRVVK